MTLQELWSLLNLYKSAFSGEQIDEALGVILNGGISAAVDAAQASADAAAKSASEAAGSAASAGAAATNAQSAASRASGSATEAESYAHGGTGKRESEDTDNARYYSEEAAESAAAAAASKASVAKDSAAAEAAARNAGNSANAAAKSAEQAKNYADSLNADLIQAQIDGKGDNLWFDEETSLLYLVSGGEVIGDGVKVATSGGGGTGGGGIAEYTITLTNLLESRVFSVPAGVSAYLKFNYISVDSGNYDDGAGVGTITVNGVKKATVSVKQGDNEVDISKYLSIGDNTVKLTVENSEGSKRSLSYTIKAVALSISTTLDDFTVQSGDLTLYYTPVGVGEKTITFVMDGKIIGTETVTASGRSQSYVIPAQAHGGHILEMYATVTVDEVLIVSDTVRRGIVWTESDNMTPIVFTTFNRDTAMEGETLTIPYMVYDPASETAVVTLEVVDYSSKDLTVGREAQSWVVQDYPTGDVVFKITCKEVSASVSVTVEENSAEIGTVTDSLAFDFNPVGRSNQEDDPASWTDGNVSATFEGVGFSGADGWLTDDSGAPMLRILPNGQMTIPFQLFASDRRDTGVTVEIEMATHNVRDYDSVVLSCLSGERGFKVASQYASLASEQSSISMQFKEDDRVRITFAVEPKALNRLIYVYVDGVMCGAIQYPADDNFQQNPAVGITIGAESSGIDLYRVLLYTKGLTSAEVLDNYIAGRATLQQRLDAYNRNDVLNTAEEIVVSKLPATLPYMVISCAELPQFKGDKKTCEISYVNPSDTARSFTADGVEIDVQGTSSAGYKKKNFKIKLKEEYKLRSTSMPATAFCMKADVASSEGANNVELVRLYNDVVPYKTAPQLADERVRVGIDGLPCVIFWHNTSTGETKFWGKYNFNDEKSSNQVYGLTDGCESWEICNNTSNRVIFKVSDYGTGWNSDFEARFPDKNTNYAKLKRLTDWIVSTDRSAVSSQSAKDARLTKFKNEFEDYFVKVPTLFYYLFTEVFLMVDSRAKNFFPSTFDGTHWLPLPYDMDTALGINNEGALVFDYDLEDTDTVNGSNVFNGQNSVLWNNVRDAFADEIKEMYADLRGGTLFNYDTIVKRFADHQAVWPEVVWNEDAYEKYLEPLLNDNDGSYLSMLQGSKASQREWWLYNALRYRDSKYQTGDAQKQFITLRCYEIGDITVTPYSHIWPRIKYGSHTVTERGKRNVPTTLINPTDTLTDTEVYIYSADRLIDVGDLSPLMVGYANFSMANKLKTLKLGDGAEGYTNTHLNELYVGNNDLLTTLDVRNCPKLEQTVDLSGCDGLETIEATGSGVKGFTLPVGGQLKTMHLPNTVANLTLRGMKQLTELTMEGYGNLTTLRIEDTPNVPLETIINGATSLERVRLIDVEWTASSGEALTTSINRLVACGGLDADGKNTDKAVVRGRVYVDSVSDETLATIYDNFPELVVIVDGVVNYIVRYVNFDGTLLHREVVAEGGNAIDPVATGAISAPTREGGEDVGYAFNGWGTLPINIHSNVTVVAQYVEAWAVRFYNEGVLVNTQYVQNGLDAVDPITAGYIDTPTKVGEPQYEYTFTGWDKPLSNITATTNINAMYTATLRTFTVRFFNESTLLQVVTDIPYGGDALYTGDNPVKEGEYAFDGWKPAPTNVTADMDCYAQFRSTALKYTKLLDKTIESYESETLQTVGMYAFHYCEALTYVDLPSVTNIYDHAFASCHKLAYVDLASVTSIGVQAFVDCYALTTLIIRTGSVCALDSSGLRGSAVTDGTGYVYVPAALVDSYKSATNWSKIANQIRAIEDYPEICG